VCASSAGELLEKLRNDLDTSWRSGATAGARFDAFRALTEDARAAWFALAIADSLTPSLNVSQGMRSIAFHDHVARSADIDVAQTWRPTADNYFGRVPKSTLLTILTEIGGATLSARYGAAKKVDIAKAMETLCAGASIVDADIRARALAWLPDEMRFDATERANAARSVDTDDDSPNAPDVLDDTDHGENIENHHDINELADAA
jgi:ParB family transcriptional regulator, chromosome partitioning protein